MNNVVSNELLKLSSTIVEKTKIESIPLQYVGGLAVWYYCPNNTNIFYKTGRVINDVDFISNVKYKTILTKMLTTEFGLVSDYRLDSIPGSYRSAFYKKSGKKICDINYNYLNYSHKLKICESLKSDSELINLTILLLSKLQIQEITEKDIIDLVILITEHQVSYMDDRNTINLNYIARICHNNWGLEHTIRKNCHLVYKSLESPNLKSLINRNELIKKLSLIIDANSKAKKSLKWKIRNHFQESFNWFTKVEYD